MKLREQLEELVNAANAKGVEQLAELCRSDWHARVSKLRKAWLGSVSAKSAANYTKIYERLAAESPTLKPADLLKCAAGKTTSKSSMRSAAAAIRWHECRELAESLRAAFNDADRVRKRAVKAAAGCSWLAAAGDVYAAEIYEAKAAPIAAKLDQLADAIAAARVGLAPMGERSERSHGQRRKLSRLPADWMPRMFSRMSRGRGGRAGKWSKQAAAMLLTGARPAELDCMTIERRGVGLVLTAVGSKFGETRGVIEASTGREVRTWVIADADAMGESRRDAFAALFDAVPLGASLRLESSAAFGSAWRAAAAREFGKKLAPSAYTARHQLASDIKRDMEGLTGPALEAAQAKLADALGHASVRTQCCYGRPSCGSGGLALDVQASGAVRRARPPDPGGRAAAAAKTRAKAARAPLGGTRPTMRGPR